jgi:hemerythrin-like domain-containing protein
MYTLNELKKQNQDVSDLIDVLEVLIKKKPLTTNPLVCELVSRFNEKVWMHLVFEDNTIYSELSKHHNPDISNIAKNFHTSAKQLKKHFSGYVKLWHHTSTDKGDHKAFTEQSEKIFSLIKDRIKFESEEIFPIVVQHYNS